MLCRDVKVQCKALLLLLLELIGMRGGELNCVHRWRRVVLTMGMLATSPLRVFKHGHARDTVVPTIIIAQARGMRRLHGTSVFRTKDVPDTTIVNSGKSLEAQCLPRSQAALDAFITVRVDVTMFDYTAANTS